MNTIQETLEYLIKAIVPDPKDISIASQDQEGTTLLTISAPKETIGQIIGKEGKIIKSIRTILGISHPNQKFFIEIKE